jgi:hypothetical protein
VLPVTRVQNPTVVSMTLPGASIEMVSHRIDTTPRMPQAGRVLVAVAAMPSADLGDLFEQAGHAKLGCGGTGQHQLLGDLGFGGPIAA